MLRMIYVSYGDIGKVQLKASGKPMDALLQTGFDVYLETAPKQWARAVDLPDNHPATINFEANAYKAGLQDANGETFTVLNALNPMHRQLAAGEGLYIAVPYSEDKREELLKRIDNIRRGLESVTERKLNYLQSRVSNIKKRLDLLENLQALQKQVDEKAKAQALWDSSLNDAFSLADILEKAVQLSPNRYDRQALNEAVSKAKSEAAMETKVEESLLLNAALLKTMREKFLENA